MTYKETLLMPQTSFEMRAKLTTKDELYRQQWLEQKLCQIALKSNKKNPKFILHDGPPYANGSLHVGHALNKILKDIIIRNKTMNGFYAPFAMGWDTHGLPIENKMLNEMKMSKDDLDPLKLRTEANKYATTQVKQQMQQFSQMQLFSDYSNYYLTKAKTYEALQLALFKKMYLDGLIYKGLKPVYWSPSSQSALAEAEVEYRDISSPKIIVAFPLQNEAASLLIMTTTPWTLVANSGVAIGKNFSYSLIEVNQQRYYLATKLVNQVASLAQWTDFKEIKTLQGAELIGKHYYSPLNQLVAPVVAGHHVNVDDGTGLVHLAPLFGEDDFIIGQKYDLKMIMHVDDKGILTKEAKQFKNLFYLDANKKIGQLLAQKGLLIALTFEKHSYPHDWRTKKPIIFRGTPQWFVSIAQINKQIIDQLKKVVSLPNWGIERLKNMISARSDWTISRQRTWGVPIIIFYDQDQNIQANEEIFDYVINLVKEHGSDIWWSSETDFLLPKKYRGQNWTREMDIMDVWFDSGSSCLWMHQTFNVAKADLYLEGNDQFRGWFNSSLINSVAYYGHAPYKAIISHGMVLDGKMAKMSKSKGNVIDPLAVIKTQGADILRLWVANSEYTSDVTISPEILKQTSDLYRKLRNTIRFMLGNLHHFKINPQLKLTGIHALIAEKYQNLQVKINHYYQTYKIQQVVQEINRFLVELSTYYFDYNKDSLYCDEFDNSNRLQVLTNMFQIVNFVIKALAPILPVTAEEAYQALEIEQKLISVHLETMPQITNKVPNYEQTLKWKVFFKLKDLVYKALEEAKSKGIIKKSNEALVTIEAQEPWINKLELNKMFMVAKVKMGTQLKVEVFKGTKCPRCWNYFAHKEETKLCVRCNRVIKK